MAFNDNISGTSDSLSGSGFDGTFSSNQYLDERSKLEQKIEKIREKITQNSIAHERDLEEYLKMANRQDAKQDNPQTIRIRQHFERKNKKYSQELAQLQKKLVDAENHLDALDKGISINSANTSSHSMLHNVSHGIKKTGNNIKEMTGTVISAPFDIMKSKQKKNRFGSADNLPKAVDNMGHSTFYVPQPIISTQSDRGRSSTLPHNMSGITDGIPGPALNYMPSITVERPPNESRSQHEKIKTINKDIEFLQQRNAQMEKLFSDHRSETKAEILAYRNELSDARFKIQQLEQTLNETMEVHQNEVKQLKSDLNLIGTRMDYQYNDRFKRIEEAVESSKYRQTIMETSLRENTERFAGGQGLWKALVLNGANIVVEILKIFLYLIAFILDFIKNFFVTRNRAIILILSCVCVAVLWDLFDISNRINKFVLYFAYKTETKMDHKTIN